MFLTEWVVGSNPTGGAKEIATQSGGYFCFVYFVILNYREFFLMAMMDNTIFSMLSTSVVVALITNAW